MYTCTHVQYCTLSLRFEARTTGVIATGLGVAPACPRVAARAIRN